MPNAAEVAEKLDFSYIIGGVLRSYSYFGKWFGSFVKKKKQLTHLNIHLPYKAVIALLGIYVRERKT